jgi:hypothetical protein
MLHSLQLVTTNMHISTWVAITCTSAHDLLCTCIAQHPYADVTRHPQDPACITYSAALLYFKGYHAIQTHRVANILWHNNRKVQPSLQRMAALVINYVY